MPEFICIDFAIKNRGAKMKLNCLRGPSFLFLLTYGICL